MRHATQAFQSPGHRIQGAARARPASIARHFGRKALPPGCLAGRLARRTRRCLHVGQSWRSRRSRKVKLQEAVLPEVDDRELPGDGRTMAAEDLDRFLGLDRRNQADNRRKHAGRVACRRAARRRTLRQQAPQAAGFSPGTIVIVCPSAPTQPPKTQGKFEVHRRIVEEITGFEIVRAVEDHVDAFAQRLDILRPTCATIGSISTAELMFRSFRPRPRLGQPGGHVGFIKKRLTMEVAQLDEIAVDHRTLPTPDRTSVWPASSPGAQPQITPCSRKGGAVPLRRDVGAYLASVTGKVGEIAVGSGVMRRLALSPKTSPSLMFCTPRDHFRRAFGHHLPALVRRPAAR